MIRWQINRKENPKQYSIFPLSTRYRDRSLQRWFERVPHPHGKTPLAIELAGLLYTSIKNHRGDICQLLTFQGPAATYRYNAFGLYAHSGNIHSPWLFSSQRYDQSTSLYHFDKREYDPHIGRWLTPDPLGFADRLNLYAYVKNNPLIYVDPYGLFWAEAGEFSRGFTRGFCDDTTLGGTYLCGNYHSPSTLGTWGYRAGTGMSMAAGLLYGGAEVRLLKGAATEFSLGPTKSANLGLPATDQHHSKSFTRNSSGC